MGDFFDKYKKLPIFSGREWGVLLLSLLLSFSTWVIHRLSLNYKVYMTVEVIAETNIEGRSDHSDGPTEIMAECRMTGWSVIGSRLFHQDPVYVRFPSSVFQQDKDDKFYIASEKLHEYVSKIFPYSVSDVNFVSDKVYFRFKEEAFKPVPVRPSTLFSFEDQYMMAGPVNMDSDSVVLVYGDKMQLEAIDHVSTATIKRSSINDDFSGEIELITPHGCRLSKEKVSYNVNVSRYIEVVIKDVPVNVSGAPLGKEFVTAPSSVDVLLYVQFPLKAHPDENISFYVDYNDLKTSITGLVMVQPERLPLGTLKYEISPVAVHIQEKK